MTLRQRHPRIEDPGHLKAIRRMPCIICGSRPCDAAHIRSASLINKKPHTGLGEKPDDKWTLPLCRDHHREQHSMNERAFWRRYGIDPFQVAKRLYGDRVPKDAPPKPKATPPRKAKSDRKKIAPRVKAPAEPQHTATTPPVKLGAWR